MKCFCCLCVRQQPVKLGSISRAQPELRAGLCLPSPPRLEPAALGWRESPQEPGR